MIQNVYSVYDSKAQAYLQPFYAINGAVAARSFAEAANKEGHEFHSHAADFTLFELGFYDDSSGTFTNHTTPVSLGVAIEMIEAKPLTHRSGLPALQEQR